MAILLSLETSSTRCSAALHDDGETRIELTESVPQSASSRLAAMVDALFKQSKIGPRELKGVIVSEGPGSYTGLRIGVSTAKGLCFALGIPLIAVNTLELMAYQVRESNSGNAMLCPMLDARRLEVYYLLTEYDLTVVEPTAARVIEPGSFENRLNDREIIFFGNGAEKCRSIIQHPHARFLEGIEPRAGKLGELGFERFKRSKFESLETFEPFYLKDFIAKKPNPA
jgi:tRNA threonylcarbamoyladenosine biosynthesis protein TsaB